MNSMKTIVGSVFALSTGFVLGQQPVIPETEDPLKKALLVPAGFTVTLFCPNASSYSWTMNFREQDGRIRAKIGSGPQGCEREFRRSENFLDYERCGGGTQRLIFRPETPKEPFRGSMYGCDMRLAPN